MKPIACVIGGKLMKYSNDPLPDECLLYPEREWVGLTDDELIESNDTEFFDEFIISATDSDLIKFGRAIEAALKEKNT